MDGSPLDPVTRSHSNTQERRTRNQEATAGIQNEKRRRVGPPDVKVWLKKFKEETDRDKEFALHSEIYELYLKKKHEIGERASQLQVQEPLISKPIGTVNKNGEYYILSEEAPRCISCDESDMVDVMLQLCVLYRSLAGEMLHNDLHVGNLMMTAGGNVVVIDFGKASIKKGNETFQGVPEDRDVYGYDLAFLSESLVKSASEQCTARNKFLYDFLVRLICANLRPGKKLHVARREIGTFFVRALDRSSSSDGFELICFHPGELEKSLAMVKLCLSEHGKIGLHTVELEQSAQMASCMENFEKHLQEKTKAVQDILKKHS